MTGIWYLVSLNSHLSEVHPCSYTAGYAVALIAKLLSSPGVTMLEVGKAAKSQIRPLHCAVNPTLHMLVLFSHTRQVNPLVLLLPGISDTLLLLCMGAAIYILQCCRRVLRSVVDLVLCCPPGLRSSHMPGTLALGVDEVCLFPVISEGG